MTVHNQSAVAIRVANYILALMCVASILACVPQSVHAEQGDTPPSRPNIVLVMADDMGWGETGYIGHPLLKTPHLDAMAATGLRFDRFYAGAPNCSPTRATVMTGRTNDRTGVQNHGFGLRAGEKTLAQALQQAGYATAHFGKWHLNGLRGPGAPVLRADPRSPGRFGFDAWLSVTNFFDRDPLLGRSEIVPESGDSVVEFAGDSSEIIVNEALKFISSQATAKRPFLTVIWYGTPHSPFHASSDDLKTLPRELSANSRHHYGELVAMDRSIGTLRSGLRDLGIANNTLLWFCSDNGGLPNITPGTVAHLRGFKNTMYEGGLRVPCVIEWPGKIKTPRVTQFTASTCDIFPTIVDYLQLDRDVMLKTVDGDSLRPLFEQTQFKRASPIGFRHTNRAAWIANDFKLVTQDVRQHKYELYNLAADPAEQHDIAGDDPERLATMISEFENWNRSVDVSAEGGDYAIAPDPNESQPHNWNEEADYQPYFSRWRDRPEFKAWLKGK